MPHFAGMQRRRVTCTQRRYGYNPETAMAENEELMEAHFSTGENTDTRLEYFGDSNAGTCVVFMSDVPRDLDERGMLNVLRTHVGKVVALRFAQDSKGGRIAFAEFSTIREVTKVIQELDRKPPFHMRVQVSTSSRNKGGGSRIENTAPAFAPPVYRSPVGNLPQKTYAVGRGAATRKATAVHRAYRNHFQSRMVHNTDSWSPGPADVYSLDKFMYVADNAHEEINVKLLSTIESSRPDNRRVVSMGRGYYVYPKKSPAKSNSPGSRRRSNEFIQNVINGVYSYGEDPQAPAIPCTCCKRLTVQKCYECGTPYCSEYCQAQDWDKHKTQCRLKVCIDVTFDSENGNKRTISLKPLTELTKTEAPPQPKISTSPHSRSSVVDALRHAVNTEGVLEVSKCSPDSKTVYGCLACIAGKDAMEKLIVHLPNALEVLPAFPSFNVEKGSLVGVYHQDGWWRGTVTFAPSINFDEYQVGLIELAKVVTVKKENMRPLPAEYANIPEFGVKGTVVESRVQEKDLWSKYLQVKADVRVKVESNQGSSIICNVKSEEGVNICQMQFERWDPAAHVIQEKVVTLSPGCRVILTSYHNQHALFVRPTGQRHVELRNTVLQQVAACHVMGSPLVKPPRRDEMVACKFLQDGNYYRAIVHEASTENLNQYKVWFVDFGNFAEVGMSEMKPLPDELKNYPFLAVKVSLINVSNDQLTYSAAEYLNELLEKEEVLRIEYGKSIDEGVILISRDGTDVNKKLNSLLQPSWKMAALNKTEVYDDKIYMCEDLNPLPLIEGEEAADVPVIILHVKTEGELELFCCPAESPIVPLVLTSLNAQINEFCESPVSNVSYNPRKNEICLARHQDGSWQRALTVDAINGGSRVVFLDFGGTENVLFRDMRRIISDFVDLPTLLSACQIKGLPSKLTHEAKEKLKDILKPNTVIRLQSVKSVESDPFKFIIDLPEVLSALRAENMVP